MNHFLVATDFNNSSESATQLAVALTKQFDAELTVLHSYHLFPAYTDMYPTLAELAGLSLPSGTKGAWLGGQSLVPVLQDPSGTQVHTWKRP